MFGQIGYAIKTSLPPGKSCPGNIFIATTFNAMTVTLDDVFCRTYSSLPHPISYLHEKLQQFKRLLLRPSEVSLLQRGSPQEAGGRGRAT